MIYKTNYTRLCMNDKDKLIWLYDVAMMKLDYLQRNNMIDSTSYDVGVKCAEELYDRIKKMSIGVNDEKVNSGTLRSSIYTDG